MPIPEYFLRIGKECHLLNSLYIHHERWHLFRESILLCHPIKLLLLVSVWTQQLPESHSYFTVYNESKYCDNVLHVPAYKAIIRQYSLTNTFKLFNCALYKFIYYNIIIILIYLTLHSVNTFNFHLNQYKPYKMHWNWNRSSTFKWMLRDVHKYINIIKMKMFKS
jgi:hypothetical protein